MSMTVFEMYSTKVPLHVFVVGAEDSKAYRKQIEETVRTIFKIPPTALQCSNDGQIMKKIKEYFHVCKLLCRLDTSCHDFWGTLVLEDFGIPTEGNEPRCDVCNNRVRVIFRFIREYRDGAPVIGESNRSPVTNARNIQLQSHEAGVILGQGDLQRIL